MTLLVISVLLIKLGRPAVYTLVPMLLVLTMSFLAGVSTLVTFYRDGNYLLVALDVIVLVTSVLVMLEAAAAIRTFRHEKRAGMSSS